MRRTRQAAKALAMIALVASMFFASAGVEGAVLCIQEEGVRLEISCQKDACSGSDEAHDGGPAAHPPADACSHCLDIPLGAPVLQMNPSTVGAQRDAGPDVAQHGVTHTPCGPIASDAGRLAPSRCVERPPTPVQECTVLLT